MPKAQCRSIFSGEWVVVWCLCAVMGLAGAEKASIEIPFVVEEAGGVARSAAPVTGGIPFARDLLTDAQLKDLRLLDESGASIPFCRTITARWDWPKGSIQWLLLDFQADFTAKQKRTFTLKLTPKVSVAPTPKNLQVSDGKLMTVDTGALKVTIPKDKFSFLGNVQTKDGVRTSAGDLVVDLIKGVPAQTDEENWQRDAPAGEVVHLSAAASSDCKAVIEFQNELRAVIKLTGTLVKTNAGSSETTAKFPYCLRLTFWAGCAEVGVRHSLTYDADANAEVIRRIGLTGDAQVKQKMIENGDAVLGGALPPGSFNNGVTETYAWLVSKDRKYLAHVPDYVTRQSYRDSFKDCDLRRPELKE